MSVNVDDVAADGLAGDQSQGEVLVLGVEGQPLLVHGPLVDGVGARVVDHLAEITTKYSINIFISNPYTRGLL